MANHISVYLNKEPMNLRNKTKSRKIKKKAKAKIVNPEKVHTFFDPKNITKLKKIKNKVDKLQIAKKWE